MSNFGNIYNKPPIYLIDGVVKEETMVDYAYQVETGFEKVGDLIGNIHGLGVDTVSEPRFINSIATAIGDMSKISPELPFGITYSSYIENFTNDGATKDFVLDLVPVIAGPDPITISAPDDEGLEWNYKASTSDLSVIGDYSVDGRVITFYIAPQNQFSLSYDGVHPSTVTSQGYMPNVYPSPRLLENGLAIRPLIEIRPSGRVRIEISKTNLNSDNSEFGANLTLEFNDLIKPYVNSIGSTKCPAEFISAWIKHPDGYRKLDTRDIYILSETVFELDTDEAIDINDTVVISLANITLADVIKDIYSTLFSHNHDKESISTTLEHTNLVNLIPVSSKPDVVYAGSTISGNDHPQYFHREGYKEGDIGTYNNAIIGDILLASTDSSSLFNNIDADSNRLTFGSTTEGISLKYRFAEKDLYLYSPENGLNIRSKTGIGKQGVGLTIDGHQLYNFTNDLTLSSASGKVRISNQDEGILGELEAQQLNTSLMGISNRLDIGPSGLMTIGGLTISDIDSDVVVTGTTTFKVDAPTFITALAGNYILDDESSISFGGLSTGFTKASGSTQALFTSSTPLGFNNTGINTGISIIGSKDFMNLYSASPVGSESTISDHDMYMESGNGEVYFLKTTTEDQIVDNEVFTWKNTESDKTRVDNLQSWPRAGINAGDSSLDRLRVNTSSIKERRGVSFGDLNHMYVTGSGTACPSGWMVLESQNGVVLTQSTSNAIDCQTISYSELTAGDIQSFGSFIAETDVSAGGNIRAAGDILGTNLNITEDIEVEGESRFKDSAVFEGAVTSLGDANFNTNVSIKGTVNVVNGVNAGSLSVDGIASFLQIANFKSTTTMEKDLTVQNNLRVEGRAIFDGKIIVEELNSGPIVASKVEATDVIYANGGIETSGDINVDGNVTVKNILNTQSNLIVNDTVFADKVSTTSGITSTGDIDANGGLTVKGATSLGISGGKLTVFGDTALNGDTFSVSGKTDIYGDSEFHGSFDVSSSASFSSTVLIKGSTDIESDLTADGTITSGPLVTNGLANFKFGAIVTGLLQTEDMKVDGRIISSGDIVASRIKADGGIEAATDTSSTVFDLFVGGAFSQTNSGVEVEFAGDTSFAKDLDIGGKVTVSSEVSIGNGDIVLKNNEIVLSGETGNVQAQTINAGSIKGSDNGISVPVSVIQENPSLGTVLSSTKFIRISDAYFDDTAIFTGSVYCTAPIYVSSIRSLRDDTDYIDITVKEAYYAP